VKAPAIVFLQSSSSSALSVIFAKALTELYARRPLFVRRNLLSASLLIPLPLGFSADLRISACTYSYKAQLAVVLPPPPALGSPILVIVPVPEGTLHRHTSDPRVISDLNQSLVPDLDSPRYSTVPLGISSV